MNDIIKKWSLIVIRALLTVAFLAAGLAKISGQEMMIATFDAIGVGQWLRHATGVVEVGGAIALWIPGVQGWAAAVLGATMVGAVLAHLLILGPSAIPAILLGLLLTVVMLAYRSQLPLIGKTT